MHVYRYTHTHKTHSQSVYFERSQLSLGYKFLLRAEILLTLHRSSSAIDAHIQISTPFVATAKP